MALAARRKTEAPPCCARSLSTFYRWRTRERRGGHAGVTNIRWRSCGHKTKCRTVLRVGPLSAKTDASAEVTGSRQARKYHYRLELIPDGRSLHQIVVHSAALSVASEFQRLAQAQAQPPRLAAAQFQHELRRLVAAVVRAQARLGLARRRIGGDLHDAMTGVHPNYVQRNPRLVHPIWVQTRRLVYEKHAAAARQRIAKHHAFLHIHGVHFHFGANRLSAGQRDLARPQHFGTLGFRAAATGPHEG